MPIVPRGDEGHSFQLYLDICKERVGDTLAGDKYCEKEEAHMWLKLVQSSG